MMGPWTYQVDTEYVNQQLLDCNNKALDRFIDRESLYIPWDSQVIYSWEQKFKANATTKIKHSYTPLVGGSVHLGGRTIPRFLRRQFNSERISQGWWSSLSCLKLYIDYGG